MGFSDVVSATRWGYCPADKRRKRRPLGAPVRKARHPPTTAATAPRTTSIQLVIDNPARNPRAPSVASTGMPQQMPRARDGRCDQTVPGVRSRMREDGLQLLDGGRAGRSVRCPVDATRQADRRVGVGEYVHAIHEDAGRPVKPQPLRLLDRLHEMRVTVMSDRSAAIVRSRSSVIFQFGQLWSRAVRCPWL